MEAPHILVIDDEKEITDLIEIYLSQEGYHVEKRYNALTLLEDIRTYQIDLVILDVMMPEINGIQALKMIREKYNIPVIIVSAKTADNDKIEGLLTGADDEFCTTLSTTFIFVHLLITLYHMTVFYSILF